MSLQAAITAQARAAQQAIPALTAAPEAVINAALRAMAAGLEANAATITTANEEDIAAAEKSGMQPAMVDRLRLGADRLAGMANQLIELADLPFPPSTVEVRRLPDGAVVSERRLPVGVIGAIYEARPNVTIDVASQLLKSRNAGVLRTGSAALRSASVLVDQVIIPALEQSGVDSRAIQLVRSADREGSRLLVRQPELVPMVIVRGSGDTTRMLAADGAQHGVRVLAHADGGGVLYLDRAADEATTMAIIEASLDRLGVCNRLNLLLICSEAWDRLAPGILATLEKLGISSSLPPHDHPRGHEWALDVGHENTVTIDTVPGPREAAAIANSETSGLAAGIVTTDSAAAQEFLDHYRGTGAFWNVPTRLLDGYKLLGAPETGINVDHVPGPRGPVTFHDLCLRQFVVTPGESA